MKNFSLILSLFVFILSANAFSSTFKWKKAEGTVFEVTGTSTLHDWKADVTKYDVVADIVIANNQIKEIKKVHYSAKTLDLKSDSDGMDEKIHEAMKAEKHKEIKFDMTGVESLKDNKFVIKGKLSIAGVEKEIKLEGTFSDVKKDSFKVKAKHPMKMTDFKIEPPSVLFISSGDEISINFDLYLVEVK